MEIAELADLLHETSEHHGVFEAAAPPHDWWDWYAAYMEARRAEAHRMRHPPPPGATWPRSSTSSCHLPEPVTRPSWEAPPALSGPPSHRPEQVPMSTIDARAFNNSTVRPRGRGPGRTSPSIAVAPATTG